jgi:hypothetical protein
MSKAVNPPKSLYHVNYRGQPIYTEAAHMSTDGALERPFFSMRTKVTQTMLVSLESCFPLLARQLFGYDE